MIQSHCAKYQQGSIEPITAVVKHQEINFTLSHLQRKLRTPNPFPKTQPHQDGNARVRLKQPNDTSKYTTSKTERRSNIQYIWNYIQVRLNLHPAMIATHKHDHALPFKHCNHVMIASHIRCNTNRASHTTTNDHTPYDHMYHNMNRPQR